LDKYLPPEYSVVIYTPGQNDDEFLAKHHMPKEEQLNIARNLFQKSNQNPRILIVTDMLLTGFDAPVEQVMYLDKPMRDHKLLQATARTNRTYPGKEAGIIIDYVGLFEKLQKALNFEERDIEGVALDFEELKKQFTKASSTLSKMFAGIKRDDTRESLFSALQILDDEKSLKTFKTNLSKVKRLYETIAPDPFLQNYKDEYTWLVGVNEAWNKLQNRKRGDLSEYQEKTKRLIKEKLLIDKIETILPTFEIDKSYLKLLQSEGYTKEQKIMDMKRALETNPIYEKLSQRLNRILRSRNKAQILAELEAMVQDIARIRDEAKQLGISDEEYALLVAVKRRSERHEPKPSEEELVSFVKDFAKELKTKVFAGWQRNPRAVKEVEKTVFARCFEKFSPQMKTHEIASLTEDLMKFVRKYND